MLNTRCWVGRRSRPYIGTRGEPLESGVIFISCDCVTGREDLKDLTASTLSSYREAWSEWLTKVFEGQPTDLVTLTFAPRRWECDSLGPTGPTRSRVSRAGSRFEKLLTRSLERPTFFIVRELGGMNGRAHLHSIVSSPEGSAIRGAMRLHAERDGFVKLSMRTGSPTEYVTKYVSKSDGDWWRAGGPLFGTRVVDDMGTTHVRVGRAGGALFYWLI